MRLKREWSHQSTIVRWGMFQSLPWYSYTPGFPTRDLAADFIKTKLETKIPGPFELRGA